MALMQLPTPRLSDAQGGAAPARTRAPGAAAATGAAGAACVACVGRGRDTGGPATRRPRSVSPLVPALLAVALLLDGCAALAPPAIRPGPMNEPVPIARGGPPRGSSGGVFNSEGPLSLTSDSRAFRVGDVVTVLLQETTQASKQAGTTLNKGSTTAITPPSVLGKSLPKLGLNLADTNTFNGASTSTQQNALTGAITVVVQEVLPNGLLRVSGEKTLALNQGEEFVRLRGYLRADDIDNSNQVSSLRIANAQIAYSGQGTLADSNTPGWLTRFFNSPIMPF